MWACGCGGGYGHVVVVVVKWSCGCGQVIKWLWSSGCGQVVNYKMANPWVIICHINIISLCTRGWCQHDDTKMMTSSFCWRRHDVNIHKGRPCEKWYIPSIYIISCYELMISAWLCSNDDANILLTSTFWRPLWTMFPKQNGGPHSDNTHKHCVSTTKTKWRHPQCER